MSWDRVVQKSHWLAEPYAHQTLREAIVTAVTELDTAPVAVLTELLGEVSQRPQRARGPSPF